VPSGVVYEGTGGVKLDVIVNEAVDVQVPKVAVTVYVPVAVTNCGSAAFVKLPPFQTKVEPGVEDEASNNE